MIKPYSKNNVASLWTDSYISKRMLEYHLQTDNDIASRNIKEIEKAVDYVIKKYNPKSLCDLGCGAGLYTNLYQQRGLTVTGVDISRNSIRYAKQQNKKVKYRKANYIDLDLKDKFDFVTMIYCDFGTLTDVNRGVMLDNAKSIMKDDGLFMFDVWNYKFYDEVPKMANNYEEIDGFYMAGKTKVKKVNYKYDDLHLILTESNIVGEHKKLDVYLWDKFFNEDELRNLLMLYELEIVDITNDEHCITVVCKKE